MESQHKGRIHSEKFVQVLVRGESGDNKINDWLWKSSGEQTPQYR